MDEREIRLKRLTMRSWRRGTKEMDLILGPYADACLSGLSADQLDAYEALLEENDQDLYPWITARIGGRSAGPEALDTALRHVAAFAATKTASN